MLSQMHDSLIYVHKNGAFGQRHRNSPHCTEILPRVPVCVQRVLGIIQMTARGLGAVCRVLCSEFSPLIALGILTQTVVLILQKEKKYI